MPFGGAMRRIVCTFLLAADCALAWDVEDAEADADTFLRGGAAEDAIAERIRNGGSDAPWLIADALVRRGRVGEAERLVASVPDLPSRKALADYISSRRDAATSDLRDALKEARLLRLRGNPDAALGRLRARDVEGAGVLGVLAAEERARCLAELKRDEESREWFVRAARRARLIGWKPRCRALARLYAAPYLYASRPYWTDEAGIAACQQVIEGDDALIAYGVFGDEILAMLVRSAPASIEFVPLGSLQALDRVMGVPYRCPDAPAIRTLRETLFDPLSEDWTGVRRLFKVPQERFVLLPWSAIVPEFSVTCVPMNCLWGFGRMAAERARRDQERITDSSVLWVGAAGDGREMSLKGALVPVCADKPLGSMLRAQPWAAIHIVCDVDERYRLHLAIEGEPKVVSWTAFLRSTARADLVILDGPCTARVDASREVDSALRFDAPLDDPDRLGEALEENRRRLAEGRLNPILIVGEVSPRAMVSLWPQAADARKELLRAFYAAWLKHDSDVRFSAVESALREAQNHVRDQPNWSKPEYWAGWQVWGAPGGR